MSSTRVLAWFLPKRHSTVSTSTTGTFGWRGGGLRLRFTSFALTGFEIDIVIG